jgi:hypothetical protein
LQEIDFRIHDAAGDYCLATWRRVMLLAWKGVVTAPGIERSRQVLDSWARRQHEGVMMVIVMAPIMPRPPSEDARKALARATLGATSNLKGIAVIYGGSSFILAGIRGLIASRNLIDRSRVPTRIFASVRDAAPWVSECLGPDHTAEGLIHAATRASGA